MSYSLKGSISFQIYLNFFHLIKKYRHIILPPDLAKIIPKRHLLTETEWRNIGIQQSPGWVHYMRHLPEPHILLFRRKKTHPVPSDFGRHQQMLEQDNRDLNFDME